MTPLNVIDAIGIHKGRCYEHVARGLSESVFQQEWDSLTIDTQTDLLMVAAHAMQAMEERGWDMVFKEDGSYGWIVT